MPPHRTVIIIGLLVILSMGIIPPWVRTFQQTGISQVVSPIGYGPIWSPPDIQRSGHAVGVKIDWSRLGLQWLLVGTATAGLCFMPFRLPRPRLPHWLADKRILLGSAGLILVGVTAGFVSAMLWYSSQLDMMEDAADYWRDRATSSAAIHQPRDLPASRRLVPIEARSKRLAPVDPATEKGNE